ncbi:MAG: MaoC family dehydratase N-terminal domain-containing protein [Novosphingobium sp.]|nr:MaoC family dehydratase N-terminal domain-containing protein [Novosphingobium sp.]
MSGESAEHGADWMAAWQPVIDRIGADMSDGEVHYGVDRAEPALIRRYLEPLEFDCPLHYDIDVARAHGFAQVTVPYTAAATFAMPPVWSPGEVLFTSADRDAQPARVSVKPRFPDGAPPVTGYFATDVETEYLRPVLAGERLGRRGNRLVACTPKETSVGRGAFVTFESDTVDEQGEVVARMRATLFLYEPHPAAEA